MTSQRLRDAREAVDFLERQRSPWEEAWRDIAAYVLPRRGRMHGRDPLGASAPGAVDGSSGVSGTHRSTDMRGGRVIDATATRAEAAPSAKASCRQRPSKAAALASPRQPPLRT